VFLEDIGKTPAKFVGPKLISDLNSVLTQLPLQSQKKLTHAVYGQNIKITENIFKEFLQNEKNDDLILQELFEICNICPEDNQWMEFMGIIKKNVYSVDSPGSEFTDLDPSIHD